MPVALAVRVPVLVVLLGLTECWADLGDSLHGLRLSVGLEPPFALVSRFLVEVGFVLRLVEVAVLGVAFYFAEAEYPDGSIEGG